MLDAFISQVQALEGKKIPQSVAAGFISSAQNIIQGSTLRGSSVVSLISSSDLTLFSMLVQEVQSAEQSVKSDIQQLINAGFTVKLVNDSLFLIIGTLTSPIGIAAVLVLGASTAWLITQTTADQMEARGHPLTLSQYGKLFLINLAISVGIAAVVVALTPLIPAWLSLLGARLGISLISDLDVLLVRYYQGIDQTVARFLGPLFDPELFALIESVLSPTPVLVRSFSITDTTFGRGVVN